MRLRASICHCGDPWNTESVPHHVIGSHAVDPGTQERSGEVRIGNSGTGKTGTHLGVDVGKASFGGNLDEVAGPLDSAGLFKFGEDSLRGIHKGPQTAMVDNEIQLWPVFCRFV